MHAVGAGGKELEAFAEQARRDWETILLARATELAPGGRMVLVNFCTDEQGRYLGNTGGVNMFDTFNTIWRRFLADGLIEADEYQGMTLPQYYKSVQEFSAPFSDSTSPVYRAGLRLEHVETRVVQCPFAAEYRRSGDAAGFAREYIPTLRSWNESTYAGALAERRTAQQRAELMQRYYGTYQSMVETNPEGHAMDYVHAYMVIAREAP